MSAPDRREMLGRAAPKTDLQEAGFVWGLVLCLRWRVARQHLRDVLRRANALPHRCNCAKAVKLRLSCKAGAPC